MISVPTRSQLEARLAGIDNMLGQQAAASAPATVYKLAQEHGLVSQAQVDEARYRYPGDRWFYAGD